MPKSFNAVTGLARQLQMTTVAEGVETLDHVNTAVVAGCDEMQRFYFSKPVRADEVEALLARNVPGCVRDSGKWKISR
jgi:EAL domain-containing protein (putative c-di-GMP-specific phosphodiesterase class I)